MEHIILSLFTDDKDKMPFNKWLWEELGIDLNYYDNNYSGSMAKQIEEEYDSYCYNGLPQFVIKYIENKRLCNY